MHPNHHIGFVSSMFRVALIDIDIKDQGFVVN